MVHDPGKILLYVALSVALGGDCLADAGLLQAEPAVLGSGLRSNGLSAVRHPRRGRERGPDHDPLGAGRSAPGDRGRGWSAGFWPTPKSRTRASWKKSFGHHVLMGFVDHGSGGTGEQVAALLRLGSAGSNTAAHHITGNSARAGPTPQAPSACSVDTGPYRTRGQRPRDACLTRETGQAAIAFGQDDQYRVDLSGRVVTLRPPCRVLPMRAVGRLPVEAGAHGESVVHPFNT